MDILKIVILAFSILGGLDYILGNRFGLGKEFERGFMLFGTMALTMIGMLVLTPLLAQWMQPAFAFFSEALRLDPSLLPASLLANDMGGAPLAMEAAKDPLMGGFNALVVSSMMGCTISFTIPFALTSKTKHIKQLYLGLLCGIVSIPIGCFSAGLICRIPLLSLLADILPPVILSGVIAAGLLLFPNGCIRIFRVVGFAIKALIIAGLIMGIINFLCAEPLIPVIAPIEDGAMVCLNASIVMSGMFPLVWLLAKLFSRPLCWMGKHIGINDQAALGLISSLATSVATFSNLDDMDEKGVTVNAAFAVCGAFVLASHLAFTMAFEPAYLLPVVIGKLIAGVASVIIACFMHRWWAKKA